jgi:toxin ParE1/3/4
MTYFLSFRPEVEEDVFSGYLWYEKKSYGLGEEFLRLFYAFSSEIVRNPLIYKKVFGDFRRRLLKRFPYAIYFQINDNKVIIFGLFHCARNPEGIKESLDGRDTENG